MDNNIKVFISYSHDSQIHKDWVRQLATDLRNKGIDTILDQWELKLGDDLSAFMEITGSSPFLHTPCCRVTHLKLVAGAIAPNRK